MVKLCLRTLAINNILSDINFNRELDEICNFKRVKQLNSGTYFSVSEDR